MNRCKWGNPRKRQLLQVMSEHEELTYNGMIWIWPKSEEDRAVYQRDRKRLAAAVHEFELALKFLDMCKIRKTPNRRIGSSYGLKHVAERIFNQYLTNGSFIAAVFHRRIPYQEIQASPNIFVAISSRSVVFELDMRLQGRRC